MAPLTLYLGNKNYSSWSLRPWLALRHARAEFSEVVIALATETTGAQIRAVSPAGRVPVLVHARDEGDLRIWDSLAICEYVNELYPDAQLWPRDAGARAVARSVAAEMHSGFAEFRAQMPMNVRARKPERARTPGVLEDIARIVSLWSECRSRLHSGGPFLFGAFSIADCMYAPVVSRFVTYEVPLKGAAAEYATAMQTLPAWKEWAEAGSGDPRIGRYE